MATNYELKLMINYGGEIRYLQPDNKLSYVDGHTKILYVNRDIGVIAMFDKLLDMCSQQFVTEFKYPLPGKDDKRLITVHLHHDDLENMMREYDKLHKDSNTTPDMQLFISPVC